MGVRPYDDHYLTILLQYSIKLLEKKSSVDTDSPDRWISSVHSVIAQLPIGGVVSLATDNECQDVRDVGPMLTQVHTVRPFKGSLLAVEGRSRKLVAMVSVSSCMSCDHVASYMLMLNVICSCCISHAHAAGHMLMIVCCCLHYSCNPNL